VPGLIGTLGTPPALQNTAQALAINFVAKNPTAKGNFLAYPTNHAPTTASTLNFNLLTEGLNIANGVIVPLCDEVAVAPCALGDLSILASNSTQVVADVVGYFAEGETPSGVGNLAIGRQALQANSTGFQNTATGYAALE